MTRDGVEYEHMPNNVSIDLVRTVATPFKSGVSKLELTRDLIEAVHQEAVAFGAGRVWMGELGFEQLAGSDGWQAYTLVVYFEPERAAA